MLTGVSLGQKHCPSCILLNITLSPTVQSSQTAPQWDSIKAENFSIPSDLFNFFFLGERKKESIVGCFSDAYLLPIGGICCPLWPSRCQSLTLQPSFLARGFNRLSLSTALIFPLATKVTKLYLCRFGNFCLNWQTVRFWGPLSVSSSPRAEWAGTRLHRY